MTRHWPLQTAEDLSPRVTWGDRLRALVSPPSARELAEERARRRRFLGRALGGRVVLARNHRLHPREDAEELWPLPVRRAG